MHSKFVTKLLLAASVAAMLPLGAAQAAPLQSAELSSLIGNRGFEFRGRYQMWKFTADGRVTADDSRIPALALGGSSEQFGIKNSATWRLAGNQLCIQWQDPPSRPCYTVTPTTGHMVVLSGPREIEGTIDATGTTGLAETPTPQAPATPPGYRYQRVPGPK